ncbi:MAG: hydrogenase maturation nickel metallochaperone HypA [Actinomycetota bacterium]|uniref:hydrogenase maturation nickel metallochaperone HypA/HybF n=1 Tax=Euzebya rosea TaxID=2052804 RepID=UPI000D3E3459|nr:hydrogenase maturation nickel metallochaperone HypA [Euzebya rosea]
MHELSIASAVAREVTDQLGDQTAQVRTVRLDVGRLSGIVTDALAYGWTFVRQDTPLADADLEITSVDVTIRCQPCGNVARAVGFEGFVCVECGTPSADFLSGTDLMIRGVVLTDSVPAGATL